MPHHESGLLALKTVDPTVLDAAIGHFLAQEPDHAIEVVRADHGRGVWLCFGSVISNRTDEHVDLSAFSDEEGLAGLAQRLGVPMWVGYAIGGFSNHQFARAYAPSGQCLWTSEFDFTWPRDLAEEANDPFTAPVRYHALAIAMRQRAGYGKIGQEFGLDYFRILEVNAGDALFATDKRSVNAQGFKALAEWLRSPWQSPEGEPGDASVPQPPADWVAWNLPAAEGAAQRLAGVITCVLEHLKVPTADARLTASKVEEKTVLVLDGPSAKPASPVLLTERFTELASRVTGTELSVYRGGEGDRAPQVAGVGAPGAMFSISMRGGAGLARPAGGKALALTASPEVRAAVEALRRPVEETDGPAEEGADDVGGDDVDVLAAMLDKFMRAAPPDAKEAPKPPKKKAASKKASTAGRVAKKPAGAARRKR